MEVIDEKQALKLYPDGRAYHVRVNLYGER
jgi:hypothetical protein